jgi:hypothetical protein
MALRYRCGKAIISTEMGRHRLFTDSRHLHIIIAADTYGALAGGMLEEYRAAHPDANLNDLVRSILNRAAGDRSGATARRRRQVRDLARKLVEAIAEEAA